VPHPVQCRAVQHPWTHCGAHATGMCHLRGPRDSFCFSFFSFAPSHSLSLTPVRQAPWRCGHVVRWSSFSWHFGGHVVFPLTCLPRRRSEPYIRCLPPLPADAHGPLDLLFDSRWWARLLISRLAASLSDLQRALARRHVCWWIRTVRWTCFLTRGGGLVYSSLAWLHRSWICSARWLAATCAGGSALVPSD
jgi:hypothetical protein